MRKLQKTDLTRNAIIAKILKIFHSKFDTTIFKAGFHMFESLNPLVLNEKQPVKERYGWVGLAGTIHHGYRFYGKKETFFVP